MNEKELAAILAKLKALDPESTGQLVVHYAEVIKARDTRIEGLLKANAEAHGIVGRITPKIPKDFKPGRPGRKPYDN